ncbi:sn-glycerol-3-phosphate ABC transporter ATP-binding protein UgpC [Moorellaceae bacterium AZ2]
MAEVSFEKVCKTFGSTQVIKEFTLHVKDHEFLVLVGPSGCGKSTVLRMLAGLEDVTSGTISINKRIVNDLPPKDRDIAMVFQNYALYPHMNVYDNMAFALKMRKFRREEIDRRVKETAKILDIADYLWRLPRELSGGQRQRVALGRAIVREPAVFLMDEPLSNLDAKLRVQMRAELTRLHQRLQTTTIYVTHDQTEAMTLGHRVVVMCNGEIQQVGTPRDIYDRPVNMFVASFVGSPPMNFIQGRVIRESEDKVFFRAEGFQLSLASGVDQTLLNYVGRELVLGIRPEHIRVDVAGIGDLEGVIEIVEELGSETYLHLRIGAHTVICRETRNLNYQVGDMVRISIDKERLHYFELPTGKALGR